MEDQSLGSLALLSHCHVDHPAGYMSYSDITQSAIWLSLLPEPSRYFLHRRSFLLLGRFGRPSSSPLRRTLVCQFHLHHRCTLN